MPCRVPKLATLLLPLGLLFACSDDGADESGSGTDGQSGSSTSSGTESSETSAPETTSESASSTGTTGAGPGGESACHDLCDAYEDCDEGVFLSCAANCDNVVLLGGYDDSCGAAAGAYTSCRYSLSCDEAIAEHQDDQVDPCEDLLLPYLSACEAAAPEACGGYCANLLECFEAEDEPFAQPGCALECVLNYAYAARTGTPACDAAAEATILCAAGASCEDGGLVGCDAESEEFGAACDLP